MASDEKGNIVYSPFSLHMLLSQAYVGSPTASETSKVTNFVPKYGMDYKRIHEINYFIMDNSSNLSVIVIISLINYKID